MKGRFVMVFSKVQTDKFVDDIYARETEIREVENVMFQEYLDKLYAENQDVDSFDTYAKDILTLQYIAYHTSKMAPGVITKQDTALLRAGFVSQFKRTEKGFKFTDWQGNEVNVSKLSSVKPIKKEFPYLTDFSKRTGTCHHDSIILALMTGNVNSKVVTGNITSLAKDHKILHSWVEFVNREGKERVADSTFNLIMDKEDYYRLRKAEPLASLSTQQIVDDIYLGLLNSEPVQQMDYKVFLLYHDDILKDFYKNPDFYLNPQEQTSSEEESQPQS